MIFSKDNLPTVFLKDQCRRYRCLSFVLTFLIIQQSTECTINLDLFDKGYFRVIDNCLVVQVNEAYRDADLGMFVKLAKNALRVQGLKSQVDAFAAIQNEKLRYVGLEAKRIVFRVPFGTILSALGDKDPARLLFDPKHATYAFRLTPEMLQHLHAAYGCPFDPQMALDEKMAQEKENSKISKFEEEVTDPSWFFKACSNVGYFNPLAKNQIYLRDDMLDEICRFTTAQDYSPTHNQSSAFEDQDEDHFQNFAGFNPYKDQQIEHGEENASSHQVSFVDLSPKKETNHRIEKEEQIKKKSELSMPYSLSPINEVGDSRLTSQEKKVKVSSFSPQRRATASPSNERRSSQIPRFIIKNIPKTREPSESHGRLNKTLEFKGVSISPISCLKAARARSPNFHMKSTKVNATTTEESILEMDSLAQAIRLRSFNRKLGNVKPAADKVSCSNLDIIQSLNFAKPIPQPASQKVKV